MNTNADTNTGNGQPAKSSSSAPANTPKTPANGHPTTYQSISGSHPIIQEAKRQPSSYALDLWLTQSPHDDPWTPNSRFDDYHHDGKHSAALGSHEEVNKAKKQVADGDSREDCMVVPPLRFLTVEKLTVCIGT